ncbi:UPF0193 protein EVG1 homolog [Bombus vosnesenskii]|uniref:UPF0193 protein EVG1 homolog n=2 Tax=Pyrobombus TaxID=144703 RepID=A0A6J3K022_9HYME|nr:UPF0193 protein EVG1 homolog [Bombus impatiens]XP_033206696.1 UPF0193 protein EVG1 homolog [Bombus vancouverensis nearcticus]XP_033345795.1 UPF0193 protein EVG1 homolog [Bombus vosnesenskii]XP_050470749.1 UPF0193 protein EVG1 homolog isoform X1 [Bombus huntii]
MDQKYQRVEMGVGAFHHPPRAKYSEETKNLIKLLMEESKVSMMKRKSIQEAINKGESLPAAVERSETGSNKHNLGYQVLMPTVWKKRSQDTIIKSGAYEREQYRRTSPLRNTEKQKRHLACMMAYGKDMPETPRGPRILHKARREPHFPDTSDPIDDLVRGIQERMEFLSDMECLGMGKKYRLTIQQEIAHKLRLIESVDKQRSKEIRKEIRELERPLPKPFPLGQLDDN